MSEERVEVYRVRSVRNAKGMEEAERSVEIWRKKGLKVPDAATMRVEYSGTYKTLRGAEFRLQQTHNEYRAFHETDWYDTVEIERGWVTTRWEIDG